MGRRGGMRGAMVRCEDVGGQGAAVLYPEDGKDGKEGRHERGDGAL